VQVVLGVRGIQWTGGASLAGGAGGRGGTVEQEAANSWNFRWWVLGDTANPISLGRRWWRGIMWRVGSIQRSLTVVCGGGDFSRNRQQVSGKKAGIMEISD